MILSADRPNLSTNEILSLSRMFDRVTTNFSLKLITQSQLFEAFLQNFTQFSCMVLKNLSDVDDINDRTYFNEAFDNLLEAWDFLGTSYLRLEKNSVLIFILLFSPRRWYFDWRTGSKTATVHGANIPHVSRDQAEDCARWIVRGKRRGRTTRCPERLCMCYVKLYYFGLYWDFFRFNTKSSWCLLPI